VSDRNGTAWQEVVAYYPNWLVWFLFIIQDASPTAINYVDQIILDAKLFTYQP
jgi:hypothetical protein